MNPGHAPDHTCWLLEEEQTLFSGDVVLGAGTVIVHEGVEGRGLFMVLRGFVRLSECGSLTSIAVHLDFFGETSLLGEVMTQSASSITMCQVLCLAKD